MRSLFWALGLLALSGCAARSLGGRLEPAPVAQATASPQPTATPAALPQTRALDEGKPVKIRSKKLRYNDASKETHFSGGVVVTQDSATLLADELFSRTQGRSAVARGHVRLSDPERKLEAEGAEAEYTDSLGEAWLRGQAPAAGPGLALVRTVDPYGASVTVTGQTAHYVAASQLAEVDGGVRIERGSLTATAKTARMDGAAGTIHLDGGVDAALSSNRARAERAVLGGKKRSLVLEGEVRARFVPAAVREAVEHPERVR